MRTDLRLAALAAVVLLFGCRFGGSPPACTLLTPDEIASALQTTGVKGGSAAGSDHSKGIDSCRWTIDGGTSLEIRIYRADSSAEGAWAMVFESAKAHATKPEARGQTRAHGVSGVGDDAMLLPGTHGESSVAFRAGRTGAVLAGRAPEAALVELAKRAAGRL